MKGIPIRIINATEGGLPLSDETKRRVEDALQMKERRPKPAAMQKVMDRLGAKIFGTSYSECWAANSCITCGGEARTFRTPKAKAEYAISAMCQSCQDDVFERPKEDA